MLKRYHLTLTLLIFPILAIVVFTTWTTRTANSKTRAASNAAVQCSGLDDTAALEAASRAGRVTIESGQTCASRTLKIPSLRIEPGGLLKPITGQTVFLYGQFEAGRYQVFTNALAGQGTVSFAVSPSAPTLYPQWWASNTRPGTTDMTAAVQAAINATGGKGKVFFPKDSYLITTTLELPSQAPYSPLVLEGEGPFLANLINKAPAGKPTLLINRDGVIVKSIGFWGDRGFPNDGIRIRQAHRIYIQGCEILCNGNGITLEESHSIFIQDNFGSMSGGTSLFPAAVTPGWTFPPTSSFVYANLPTGGFAHHIIIQNNINESYNYQVLAASSGGYGFSWVITGNQFEGSTNGLKLDNLNDFEIVGNYLGEGGSGYPIDLNNCRQGRLGPNYVHFQVGRQASRRR